MEVFQSIDCSGCNKVIAFQHKVNDKIYGAPYAHGPECFSNAYRAASAGAAADFNRILQMQRATTPVPLKTDSEPFVPDQVPVTSSSSAAAHVVATTTLPAECIRRPPAAAHSAIVEKIAQQPTLTKPTVVTATDTEKVVRKPAAARKPDVDTVADEIVEEPTKVRKPTTVDVVDSGASSGPVKTKPSQSAQEVEPTAVKNTVPVSKAEAITNGAANKATSSKSTQRYLWSDCVYSPSLLKANAAVTTQFPWSADCVMVGAKEDEGALETFQKVLEDYVSRASVMTAPPEMGEIVVASYEGEYFRGRINRVSRDKCEVKFIDFGDRVKCKFSDIFPADASIMKFPVFGLTVSTGISSEYKIGPSCEKALYPKNGFIMNLTCKGDEAVPSKEPLPASLCIAGESTTLTESLSQLLGVKDEDVPPAAAQIATKSPAKEIKSVAAPAPPPRPFTWNKCKYSTSFVQNAPVHVCYQWSPIVYHINASNDQDAMQLHHDSLGKYARKWKAEFKTFSGGAEIDDIVIADYEGDYFRGRVEKVEGTECTISFVDYGDSLKCQVTDIIPITETIMTTPIYGMKVRLSQTPDCSDMQVIETLESAIFQPLVLELPVCSMADLKPSKLPIEITLWDETQQKTINGLVKNAITSSKK